MSNSVDATLQDAFELIEQGQLEEARTLLEPLLKTESDNPAVWWIYAHAVDDPDEGHKALDRVIQLDPTYPGASDLKTQITMSHAPATGDVDDWDDLDFEPDTEFAESANQRRSPIRFLVIAALVIVGVIALFAILSSLFGTSEPTPTAVAEVETEIPTTNAQIIDTVEPTDEVSSTEENATATDIPAVEETDEDDVTLTDTPTEIPATEIDEATPTLEPTDNPPTDTVEPTAESSFASSIAANLGEYEVAETDIEVRSTLLGETLVVNVCATPGPESSLILNGVMDVLVDSNSSLTDDIEAIAVSLIDCANDDGQSRTIGVDRTVMQQLADEEIELKDFQRAWQPLP